MKKTTTIESAFAQLGTTVSGRLHKLVSLFAFPTWIIMKVSKPWLYEGHPFKENAPSLLQWYIGETKICRCFDILFWLHGSMTTIAILKVWGILARQ